MTARANFVKLLVSLLTVVVTSAVLAADWDSCADDLDRLRRATRDAADKASDVKSKAEEFENCRRYPDVYDLWRDGCRSKGSEYQSAVRDLESELSTVDSRIRSVRFSCGYDLGSTASPRLHSPETGNQVCDLYRSYLGRLPLDALLKTCLRSMSETDCRKCLTGK